MTARRGSEGRMTRLGLDPDTTDRLLSGRVAPDDAPPGYAEVARLLTALREPASPAELRSLDEAVTAAARRATEGPATPIRPAAGIRPARRSRPRRARAAILAFAVLGLLLVTTGLAMAGALPDAAQNVVSDALSRIGIHVPTADERDAVTNHHPAGLEERPPTHAPTGPGGTEAIRRPEAPGASSPSASSPNASGTARANDASDGKSEQGTSIADERSGGHSSAGSANSGGHGRGDGSAPDHQGNGPPADHPGNGPPAHHPGNGPPESPGN
jgi:hypothetical protein